jgi:alginate O-acetyltransferase complex protein AlgI
MSFVSLAFVIFALLTTVGANWIRSDRAFEWFSVVANAVFILSFSPVGAIALYGFVMLGFAAMHATNRWGAKGLASAIVALLVVFVILKKYEFVPSFLLEPLTSVPVEIGLSYVLFRVLHTVADAKTLGELPRLLGYMNYCLSCFALISGPIQRWEQYRLALGERRSALADRSRAARAMSRIATGYVRVVLLAPLTLAVQGWLLVLAAGGRLYRGQMAAVIPLAQGSVVAIALMVLAAALWLVFLYFNFAGYCDIVIGWARICGLDLPENFDRPFLANSFLEYWNRWHMTLSRWFRIYVFTPVLKILTKKRPEQGHAAANATVALFITFLLVGLWHGTTLTFLIYGAFCGVGAGVNYFYRDRLREWLGRERFGRINAAVVYQSLCAGITFCYLGIAAGPFWLDRATYLSFLRQLAGQGALAVVLACLVICGGIWLGRRIYAVLSRLRSIESAEPKWWRTPEFSAALKINLTLLALLGDSAGIPDFIYGGF